MPLKTDDVEASLPDVGSVASLYVNVNMEGEVLRFMRVVAKHGLGREWSVDVRDGGERVDIHTTKHRYRRLDALMFSLLSHRMEDYAAGTFDDEELGRTLSVLSGMMEDLDTHVGMVPHP